MVAEYIPDVHGLRVATINNVGTCKLIGVLTESSLKLPHSDLCRFTQFHHLIYLSFKLNQNPHELPPENSEGLQEPSPFCHPVDL
jgi:hypothetical protein